MDPNYISRWIDYKIPDLRPDPGTGITSTSRLAERATLMPDTGMKIPGEEDEQRTINTSIEQDVYNETEPRTTDTSLEGYQQIRQLPHETTRLNIENELDDGNISDTIIAQPGSLNQQVATPALYNDEREHTASTLNTTL